MSRRSPRYWIRERGCTYWYYTRRWWTRHRVACRRLQLRYSAGSVRR